MREVGSGVVRVNGDSFSYAGTMPNDVQDGEEVVILRASTLDLLISAEENSLRQKGIEMSAELFNLFPDPLVYTQSNIPYKLFLDRHMYSRNRKDQLWFRYCNVDQFLIEEGLIPPKGGPKEC